MAHKKLSKKKIVKIKRKNPREFHIRDLISRFDRLGTHYRKTKPKSIDGDLCYAIAQGFISISKARLFEVKDKLHAVKVLNQMQMIIDMVKEDLLEELGAGLEKHDDY